jgi:SAM-dependent methyltransferase
MNPSAHPAGKLMTARRREPEIMDQPGLDPVAHAAALRGLTRLNWLSNSAALLWPAIRDLARGEPARELQVLDVATGAADVPLRLARRAQRAGLRVTFAACDASPTALDHARRRAAEAGVRLRLIPLDVLSDPLPDGFDVMTCSLFLHHLDDEQAVDLLRRMAAAARLVLVNDLVRGRLNRLLVSLASHLVTRSPVVHADGPRSAAAAFTVAEMTDLCRRAGLDGAVVRSRFPCRMLVTWSRP